MSKSARPAGFVSKNDYIMIDPRHVVIVDGWNPRSDFSADKMAELKESIRATGVYNPIRVTVRDGKYILRDGERRLRCCLELIEEGHDIVAIPAMTGDIKRGMTEADHLLFAMVANLGDPLKPFEEAEAFYRLINYGMTPNMIAERLGKSVTFVNNRLTLRSATPALKEAVEQDEVTLGEAVTAIKEAVEPEEQVAVAAEIKEEKQRAKEVKKAEKKIAKDKVVNDVPVVPAAPIHEAPVLAAPVLPVVTKEFVVDDDEVVHEKPVVKLAHTTWEDELAGMVDDHGLLDVLRVLVDYTNVEEVKCALRSLAEEAA